MMVPSVKIRGAIEEVSVFGVINPKECATGQGGTRFRGAALPFTLFLGHSGESRSITWCV